MYIYRKPAVYPTATRLFRKPGILNYFHKSGSASIFISVIMIFIFAACSSSSIDTPDLTDKVTNGNDLVVTLSSPTSYKFPTSRADDGDIHAGHKLRYVVMLSRATDTNPSINPGDTEYFRRSEVLAEEGTTKVIFQNAKPARYFVTVFADYIREDAQTNADGLYDDLYYNTHNTSVPDQITLLAQGSSIFNNHNLDCFSLQTEVQEKKTNVPLDFNVTLKRCVCQIKVVATGEGSINALKDISINNYSVRNEFSLSAGYSNHYIEVSYDADSPLKIDVADRNHNLLYFFYTLNNPIDPQREVSFTLNPNEGYEFTKATHKIPGGDNRLTLTPNTIFNVQGNFLNTSKAPSTTAELNITTATNWENLSQNPD